MNVMLRAKITKKPVTWQPAGMIGTIGMWARSYLALLITLTMVLPMAGVDAMDAVPENGNKSCNMGSRRFDASWYARMVYMLPDGGDSVLGTSGWMAGAAMSMGLGSALIGQFIEENE